MPASPGWRNWPGLQFGISLFAVFCIVAMWAGGVVYFRYAVEREVEDTYRINDNLAAAFAAHTAQALREIEGIMRVVALEHQRSGPRFDLPRFAKEAGLDAEFVVALIIVAADGKVVQASQANYPVKSYADREHFLVHVKHSNIGLYSGRPVVGRYSKDQILPFSVRISGPGGEFQGTIVAGVNPLHFVNLYRKVNLGSKGAVSFFGLDGFIRARLTAGEVGVGQDVSKALMIKQARENESGRLQFTAVTDKVSRYYSYQRVPGYPLAIAVGQADDEALEDETRNAHAALVGGVIVTLLLLAATLLLLRGLARDQRLRQSLQERSGELQAANEQLTRSLDDLSRAQSHLVQTEKMAALGGLVAGVAHEINTPVGIGFTAASHLEEKVKALAARYQADALSREDLTDFIATASESSAMVLANLQRAAELIRSFKQVAVDQSGGHHRQFYLKDYLQEVLRSLGPQLGRTRHEVSLSCPDELALFGNPGDFSQIITNLVMNSLLHGFEGIAAGHIAIAVNEHPEGLLMRYSDDGRGIAAQHLAQIFDPFYTTRRGLGGSGLGLYVIYNLITQGMGGRITCSSTPGQGVVFEILIPHAAIAMPDAGQAAADKPGDG